MPYASRPMGDYARRPLRGDPGFLSGLFKGLKKFVAPVLGAAIGGPIGAVIGGLGAAPPKRQPPPFALPGITGGAVTFPGGTSIGLGFAPGQPGVMVPGQGPLPPFMPGGVGQAGRGGTMVPSGYHFAKDGSGRLVRNRRMNVANPRALRRAMRRAQGFEKLARRSINFNKRVRPARRKSCS